MKKNSALRVVHDEENDAELTGVAREFLALGYGAHVPKSLLEKFEKALLHSSYSNILEQGIAIRVSQYPESSMDYYTAREDFKRICDALVHGIELKK